MESRVSSFTSPVRPKLSTEESTDPEAGSIDEEIHFDKDEEIQPTENPSSASPPPTEANVPSAKPSQKLSEKMHLKRRADNNADSEKHPHQGLRPMIFGLSITCLVVAVATTVSHIVLDDVVGAAIILAITCPIIAWGVVSLILKRTNLVCIYGFLLIFESIALIVAGGLEVKEFISQMEAENTLSKQSLGGPSGVRTQTLEEAQRRTKILAAFTVLYFACALIFIVTAVLNFHFCGGLSLKERLRKHHKAEDDQQAEQSQTEMVEEGAATVPAQAAPSPDLFEAEELLDVEVTESSPPPQAEEVYKQAEEV